METTRKHNTLKYWKAMLGACLIVLGLTSCTYDYFVDENNFRIYVPQIERGEIKNFYVAIHDASGRHILTREIEAPFDKDDFMKQGILRFKLPYGANYTFSCFADYEAGTATTGESYSDSYFKKTLVDGTKVYAVRNTNPRAFLTEATVYPMGHPEASVLKTVDIDEKQRYKGKIKVNFKDLPPFISQIDIYYKGIATKYYFDGSFAQFSPNDLVLASFNTAEHREGNKVFLESTVNPSSESLPFGIMGPMPSKLTRASSTPPGAPLEFEMRLFSAARSVVGIIPFTKEDFQRLKAESPSKVPKAGDGSELEYLVLEPQKTIIFNFEEFTVASIELVSWGDIIGGETTPM